jgi:sterol desaturase/sphingolipid hydroxylase (fatty acid hydroxylase superfamily)
MKSIRARFDRAIRYLLYPLSAAAMLAYLAYELNGPKASIGHHYGWYVGTLVILMILIESAHALRADWRVTWATFWRRDLPFLVVGASTIALANWVALRIVTEHAMTPGRALAQVDVVSGVVMSLLVTDFLWYWVHRLSHEARGRTGRWLWRVHVAHHLPKQVYVLMHAIGHPINAIVVRAILTIPPFLMGFSPEVVFATGVVTGLQGLVSHFNVDSRVGWLNYLLVGTELHRYHHSADPAEAKNFGAVVSVWDQLFGTFVYRPAEAPRALGIDDPAQYPADTQLLSVLALPLRRSPASGA